MKGITKRVLLIIFILFLTIALVRPLLAGTSISGTASCRIPFIITMPNGAKLVAEEVTTEQNTNIVEDKKGNDSLIAEQEHNYITQQEEKISEDSEEVELINTVCAR